MRKQVIGITGGIGCGKSAVMDILEKEYGAAVILADRVGHELMKPGAVNYNNIVACFGNEILDENGIINRKLLGTIVFGDKEKLTALNQITHPNIIKEIKRRIDTEVSDPDVSFVCLESAILLDTNLYQLCDTIWYIYANEESRIERLMAGRGYTEEYCKTVMAKQEKESAYREKATVIIDNSGCIEESREQVRRILSHSLDG